MANGVPVRLSEALTVRARTAAAVLERSLTEQVEHWARLGQAVEAAISSGTLHALKARSHDPELAERLAVADTAAGRKHAAQLIKSRAAGSGRLATGDRAAAHRARRKSSRP